MGCDMVVALGRATGNGGAIFGHNSHRPPGEGQRLVRLPARQPTAGETVRTQYLTLQEARQTYAVLGSQPQQCWGLTHGVNEHRLAVGCADWAGKLHCDEPGVTGTDLTRLALERCRTACQALDLLTSLVARHGQGRPAAEAFADEADHLFLIADPTQAFALEAAGDAWVVQEILEVRAASDLAIIRQDWDRISAGLGARIIARGWWKADGSKLDFADTLNANPTGVASALRRWGRATVLLEQQNGRVEPGFVRHLLSDHYEGTQFEADPVRGNGGPVPLCRHGLAREGLVTSASLVAELSADRKPGPLAWCAFGPPCVSVYFPVFLEGELPPAFTPEGGRGRPGVWQFGRQVGGALGRDAQRWQAARQALGQLQHRFDQEAAEFAAETAAAADLGREAGALMQSQVERFEDAAGELLAELGHGAAPAMARTE
jgi:dipeptidase